MMRIWRTALRVSLVLAALSACGQEKESAPPRVSHEDFSPYLSAISPFLIPKVIADGYQIKEFIRSEEFAGIRAREGDRRAVDELFERAMRLSWDNVHEALLITLFGVMDHKIVGVRLPVLGDLIWVPLTSEFEGDFRARLHALPSRLYDDSPPGAFGDRDKLQHFFGSAFLTSVTGSVTAADRAGVFVEWGEESFIVGGTYDERDLRANRQGQLFARSLSDNDRARPSDFFVSATALTLRPGLRTVPDSVHVPPEAP